MRHAAISPIFALAALLLLASSAQGGDVSVPDPVNPQSIKATIDGAQAGDTVVIPAGTFDFGTARLTLPPGVSLRGAGFRSTVFQSSVDVSSTTPPATPCTQRDSGQDALLCVTGTPTPGAPSSIIEGIAFNNAAQNAPPVNGPYPGPSIGISVRTAGEHGLTNRPPGWPSLCALAHQVHTPYRAACEGTAATVHMCNPASLASARLKLCMTLCVPVCAGPSAASRSQIKACAFRGFWKARPAGIGILFIAGTNNWDILDSVFVNNKHGVYYNSQSYLTITGNFFTK